MNKKNQQKKSCQNNAEGEQLPAGSHRVYFSTTENVPSFLGREKKGYDPLTRLAISAQRLPVGFENENLEGLETPTSKTTHSLTKSATGNFEVIS